MKVDTEQLSISPRPIIEMGHGYWASQILYVATRLGIFTKLSGKSLTCEEIAKISNLPLDSVGRLLNACCALNLLKKENGKYRNLPLSDRFLVYGKEGYLGHFVSHMGELYTNWGKLLQAVREGKSVNDRFGHGLEMSDEESRNFTLAMHDNSSQTAPFLADLVDLSDNKRLLDLGGGSGVNSMVLAERNPQLEVVVYDFPAVLKVAKEFINKSKAADKIKTQAGDYSKDNLPKGFDCVLLSHILHAEGEEASIALLKKCYEILEPQGKIIIVDFLLNENKNGPVFPTLFALNMLIETPRGNVFTVREIGKFLETSGFALKETKPLGPSPASVVLAYKP